MPMTEYKTIQINGRNTSPRGSTMHVNKTSIYTDRLNDDLEENTLKLNWRTTDLEIHAENVEPTCNSNYQIS